MPGFASPIELSIPTSVSAMRTGAFPSRGSGVTVFVTNASSERATSGAVSASRQPLAFRRRMCFDGSGSEGRLANDHALDDPRAGTTGRPVLQAAQSKDRRRSIRRPENAVRVNDLAWVPVPLVVLELAVRRIVARDGVARPQLGKRRADADAVLRLLADDVGPDQGGVQNTFPIHEPDPTRGEVPAVLDVTAMGGQLCA